MTKIVDSLHVIIADFKISTLQLFSNLLINWEERKVEVVVKVNESPPAAGAPTNTSLLAVSAMDCSGTITE